MNNAGAGSGAAHDKLRAELERLRQERAKRASQFERIQAQHRHDITRLAGSLTEESRARQALLYMLEDVEESRLQIQQAHREWLHAVDALRDPVLVHDADCRILRCNRAYAGRSGLAFRDIVGRFYWECFPKREGPLSGCGIAASDNDASTHEAAQGVEFTLDTGEIFVSRAYATRDPSGSSMQALLIFEDISERRRAEKTLKRTNRALRTLSAGNEALIRASEEAGLLQDMTRVLTQVGGYPIAIVGYAVDDAEKTVAVRASTGIEADELRGGPPISWADNARGQSAVGRALRLGSTQFVEDVRVDPGLAPWGNLLSRRNIGSAMAMPLRMAAGERPFAAIGIAAARGEVFDADEVSLLEELAADLAFGIVNLRMRAAHEQGTLRLQRSMESTVQAIAATVEMRDPYTAGHQNRVAELAATMAREMGLPEDQSCGLRLASIVHDVGKIQIPAEILSKPTRLTDVEYEIIKTHVQSGYEILKDVDFPWPIAEIVRQHHERLDGSGYPRGLKGDDILIEAKILAVADTIEAMGAARPYRPAVGIEVALQEVSRGRGRQYDSRAVDACLRLFAENRFAFARLREGVRI